MVAARSTRLVVQLGAADPREPQQVVDQQAHLLAAGREPLEHHPALVVQALAVIFEQGDAEAVDAAQRRAQVVRDGEGERLKLGVEGGKLGGPVADALFEVDVERAELRPGWCAGCRRAARWRRPSR